MTILSRDELLAKAQPRRAVMDIDGFGKVALKSVSNLQQSRREVSYQNDPEQWALSGVYSIIDQVTDEQGNPMFTEDDIPELAELDPVLLQPLFKALEVFNGPERKNAGGVSIDT